MQFAELYARAVALLGDPRPAQRIGGVHTLEQLAQQHPRHRQDVADLICASLRAPHGDEALRGAMLRALVGHLRPAAGSGYWAGVNIDLTGALLAELDLTGCHIDGDLILCQTVINGQSRLRGVHVAGDTDLRGATFRDHLWCERSTFRGMVLLQGAVFGGDAWFGETHFVGPASFVGADFAGHAWFGGATMRSAVDFGDAVFRRSAGFRGANAYGAVGLTGTTFVGPARVSRRGDGWNFGALGWQVEVDRDNSSVGQLVWAGHGSLIESTPV